MAAALERQGRVLALHAAGEGAHPLADAGVDRSEVVVPGRDVGGHGGADLGVGAHGAGDQEQHGTVGSGRGSVEDSDTRPRAGDSGNLAHQLRAHRLREGGVVGAGQGEAAGAADHLLAVVVQQVRLLVQHRQPVDRDAGGDAEVAHRRRRPALVVPPVARDVEHQRAASRRAARQQRQARRHALAERRGARRSAGAARRPARRRPPRPPPSPSTRSQGTATSGRRRHAGPEQRADRHRPARARRAERDDGRVAERGRVAAEHQAEFVVVDARRHVHGEAQGEVHGLHGAFP